MTSEPLSDLPLSDRIDQTAVQRIHERLGRYVYLLIDPRDSRPFYVGKGQGGRMLAHGDEADDERAEGRKVERIRSIRSAGLEPEIWVARYGLSASEYTAVEAALIDVLSSFPIRAADRDGRYQPLGLRDELTNARREDAKDNGLVPLARLVDELAAPELTTDEPLLVITLKPWVDRVERGARGRLRHGDGFRREWVDPVLRAREIAALELALTSWWRVSPREVARQRIEHVVPLFRGLTRGLFHVDTGSWERRSDGRAACVSTPVEDGPLWDAVVGEHGHRVPGRQRGSQNPVLYWPR